MKAIPKYGRFGLEYVTTWWTDYQLQSIGYDQLIRVSDDPPDDFDELIRMLNYTKRQALFNTVSKNTEDIVMQYKSYLANNHS